MSNTKPKKKNIGQDKYFLQHHIALNENMTGGVISYLQNVNAFIFKFRTVENIHHFGLNASSDREMLNSNSSELKVIQVLTF